MTALGVRNEEFAKEWYRENEEVSAAAGTPSARQGARRRRRGGRGGVPRRRRGREPHLRAVRCRTRHVGRHRPRARPGRRPGPQPLAGRTLREQPGATAGMALVPITAPLDDVLAEIRRAKDHGLGGVMIPAMWVNRSRTTTVGTTPCGRCARSSRCRCHPLRSAAAPRVRRPPRHLRHRGDVVAGPPPVVPAVVGSVRTVPEAAVRCRRSRLLVAPRVDLVLGPPRPRSEGHGEARQGPVQGGHLDAALGVLRPQHAGSVPRTPSDASSACVTRSGSATSAGATTSRIPRAPGPTPGRG